MVLLRSQLNKMNMRGKFLSVGMCLMALLMHAPLNSQDQAAEDAVGMEEVVSAGEKKPGAQMLRIYISGISQEQAFIRKSLPYVDLVRDPKLADVQVILTSSRTASGGQEFRMEFLGREEFSDMGFELSHTADQEDTYMYVREDLIRIMKAGLSPYLARKARPEQLINGLKVSETTAKQMNEKPDDPWNNWIFTLRGDGSFYKDDNYSNLSLRGSFEVNRITEKWKTESRAYYSQRSDHFQDEGGPIISKSSYKGVRSSLVRSINDKWSAGVKANAGASTYHNKALSYAFAPAIEYNIFPWEEVDRRVFTIAYSMGIQGDRYMEETIFEKMEEFNGFHALEIDYRTIQPWGEAGIDLKGSQFLNDPEFYSVGFGGWYEVRVTRNLSLDIWFEYESIHNQKYLPAGNASLEEILLRRRSMATTYEYSVGLGLNFKFGSIYNNVVNQRL